MSQTIDDRIVQLEFDNDQFEKNVNESLTTLQKLKSSLDLEKSAKNLTALTEASNKVDFSHLSESIDSLNDKFSTMRMAGLMALSNIVDGAMGLAKKLGSVLMAPISQMKTGGWARAMNLEQAQFMLEGMTDLGVDAAAVMENVNDAVSGTAYSLDEAAKVAGQFAASGIQAGDDMLNSLKAVSGVAGMTGSSFAEIGDIFASIAGQGKMMKYQLNQLSSRGLNAAAVMAAAWGTTEEEIREMVHNGEVSFQDFSDVMFETFGEHAKKANETFEGALSNMKSALNRIGAEFAKPIIRDAIPVFNALREMINGIKANMGDVISIFDKLSSAVSDRLVYAIDRITSFIKSDSFKNNGLKDLNEALYRTIVSLIKIGNAISEAFHTVFNGSIGDKINDFCKGLNNLTKILEPTEDGLFVLQTVLTIIFSVIKDVGTAIGFVVKNIAKPAVKIILRIIACLIKLIGVIVNVTGAIGDFIRENRILERIISGIGIIIQLAKDRFEEFKRQLSDTSTTVGKVAQAISKAFKTIGSVILTIAALPIMAIYTAFQKLRNLDFTRVISALKNFKQLVIDTFNYIKELPVVQGIIEGIKLAFMGLIGVFYYVGTAIESFFTKLADGEITIDSIRAKILDIPNAIKRAFNKIQAFVNGNTVLSKVLDGLKNVVDFLKKTFVRIKEAFAELTPAKAMLFAFAMSMLSMSLIFNKLGITLDRILKSASINLGLLKIKLNGGMFQIDKYTAFVSALASALTALTVAFWVLGNQVKNLKETAIILGSFIGVITLLVGGLAILQKILKIEGAGLFREFAWDMAIMAAGVMSIALAIKILSDTSLEGIVPKLVILASIMGVLLGISVIFNKFDGVGSFKTAVLLIAFAGSVVAICLALRALNDVDLSGLKGAWPELLAILGGIAAVAVMMSKISSILIASIAVLAVLLIFSKKLYDIGSQLVNNIDNSTVLFEKFKAGVDKIANLIEQSCDYIYNKFKDMSDAARFMTILAVVATIAGAIIGIKVIVKTMGAGILEIAKEGKYIKRLGLAFLMFAAGIAGLIYMTKLLADWIDQSPNFGTAITYITELLVVCAGFVALSHFGNEKAIKKFSGFLVALSVVILSLGAFSVMLGTLNEEEFARATNALMNVLAAVGIMILIIGACSILASKGNPAGFGTFAGITMLFAAIIGSIAWLMLSLKEPQDYANLGAALLSIGIVFTAIYALFTIMGKIQNAGQWKTIVAIFGGLALIGVAIAGAAKLLPNEHYIEKVATVGVAMIAMLAVVTVMAIGIHKFSEKAAKTFNPQASKNIYNMMAIMGELILGMLVIAGSLALLQKYDPKDMIKKAEIIVLVLAELAIIGGLLGYFAGQMTLGLMGLAALGIATVIFAALALVIAGISKIDMDWWDTFNKCQLVALIILELSVIAVGLGALAPFTATGLIGLAALAIATVIFAALAAVVAGLSKLEMDWWDTFNKCQLVALIILELSVIAVGLGALAPFTAAGLIGMAALAIATAVFVSLAFTIKALQDLDLEEAIPRLQLVEGVITYLLSIMAQLALLTVGAAGMIAGAASMLIVVASINLLVEALRKINEIGIDNVSAGLEQIAVALGMLTDAGQALSDLGKGLLVLALGIAAVGAACLIAAPGILALGVAFGVSGALIGTALNLIAAATDKLLDSLSRGINGVKQFFSDLVSSFTNNPAVQLVMGAAKKLGGDTGESFTDGFRNSPIEWHSPPGIITSFLSDAASAFVNSPAAQGLINAAKKIADFVAKGFEKVFRDGLGWHSDPDTIIDFLADAAHAMFQSPQAYNFIESARKEAKEVTNKFSGEFKNSDIGNITEMFSAEGMMGLTKGVSNNKYGYIDQLNGLLGITNQWAQQMQNAIARGEGVVSNYAYQLKSKISSTKRELEKWDSYRSTTSTNRYYSFDYAQEQYNKTEKELSDLENQYDLLTGAVVENTEMIEENEEAITGAGNAAKDFVSSLEQTLASQMNIFSKFEQKNPMNKDELLNNMKSQIKGMTDWSNQMAKLASMGIDQGLYKKLAEMGPQGAEYVGAFVQMSAEELGMANELWVESLVLPGAVANQIGVNMESIGENTLIGYQNGLDAQTNATLAKLGVIAQDGVDTFAGVVGVQSPSVVFHTIGEFCMIGLYNGFNRLAHLPIDAITRICNKIVEEARRILNEQDFETIGVGVVNGLAKGLENEEAIKRVKEAVETLNNAVILNMKGPKGFDERSPSHVTEQIGAYVAEGLAVGISKHSDSAINAARDMADDAVNQMKSTIAKISDAINNEMEDPVITPVLDLSKVQAGARLLNSTFSANAAIAAGASQLGALQNGQYPGGNVVFNQYNNSPKALSRIDIYRDTRNMLSQFKQAST